MINLSRLYTLGSSPYFRLYIIYKLTQVTQKYTSEAKVVNLI